MNEQNGNASNDAIIKPSDEDILCGRGHQYYEHPGNRFFRETIDTSLKEYIEADSKLSRTIIVSKIHKNMRKTGRFLRYDKSTMFWIQLSDNLARQKIGQAMRQELTQHDADKREKDRKRRKLNKTKREALRKGLDPGICGTVDPLAPKEECLPNKLCSLTETIPFESILLAVEMKRESVGLDGDAAINNEVGFATKSRCEKADSQPSSTPLTSVLEGLSPQQTIKSCHLSQDDHQANEPSNPYTEGTADIISNLRKELERERIKSSLLAQLLEDTLAPEAPLPFLRQKYLALMSHHSFSS